MVESNKKEIDYKSLIKEYDNNGVPTSYICEVHQNQSQSVIVEYFYDLIHSNCTGGASVPLNIANMISLRLVQQAAKIWNIMPSGETCLSALLHDDIWLVGVLTTSNNLNSTLLLATTPTRIISDFGCQILTPNSTIDECCHVLRSEITFRPLGGFNMSTLISFVHGFINTSSSTVSDNAYRTASIKHPQFIEDVTMNDEARNNVKEPNRTVPVVPAGAITQQSSERGEDDITITGGFLIASLISVMFGVFFILFRRHRSSNRRHDMVNVDDTFREKGDDDDDFHVTVVNDPNYNSFPVKRQITCRSCVTETNDAIESELLDFDIDDHPVSPKYAFDLGQSLKMNVMGTYAPTTIPVVAPYPLGGIGAGGVTGHDVLNISGCDSEAEDSWAQTDGTVGSLEDRLEEITAEI